ncbi:phenylalanine--tRNA ligase subunit beta [Candidatus Falkowbacteria bacterium CG11_big_fil_rev_8_21_14_0_20_39_10]|uniref:Phenylalanine--tRNA ligase beta subunit n=1 Tax=Candidatus Falkowbacteria bacterium CG11_big_fil_rev_8_21_14_0_20_39_10 TaxID=1974570 RepID=A0A2M6K8J4_9BACT|nr:MAG: phenylalanine--tRNA ligase subunit beta [Candidatus Falkowbacteria bacterium CG11_big_fil_rev_8_21_14_0_20_39_10]
MYLSLNWLKDFVKIPKSVTPEVLGLRLTMHTVEIDSVAKQADKYKNVVIGKILEVRKHPNADKLLLAKVDVGQSKLDIVCGAANIKAGQLAPVALVGAILPNGMEIKETEVRGEKSQGMLCAQDELGLGSDHSEIVILEKGKVGQNFGECLKIDDVIFEVDNKSITHRPDLWGHFGMARETAAFLNTRITTNFKRILTNKIKVDKKMVGLEVKVEDFKLCPRYMAVVMEGIKVGDSPRWMQDRLIAVGMRPINNIVDITNYVMLELGQPLHAFDRALISADESECKIVVRQAKKGEELETLDSEKRKLDENTLVIADDKKAIALAGVMGGADSEISVNTASIVIESANFDAISVRKTAQKLDLRTESSARFEKSLDPNLCETAITRTVELIKKVCPKAKVAGEVADAKEFSLDQGPIKLDLDWLDRRIGQKIEKKEVVKILTNLGFKVEETKSAENSVSIIVPTWRATKDISIPEDLVEEVARIYGYDNLKPVMPVIKMEAPKRNEERILERKIKSILSQDAKLAEVYNYSFVGEEQLKKLRIDSSRHIRLANPISSEHTLLRQSLVPNLILNIRSNQARYEEVGLFEVGSVYFNLPGDINKNNESNETLPFQEKRIGLVLAANSGIDVFSKIKGRLGLLGLDIDFEPIEDIPGWAETRQCAKIVSFSKNLGLVAKVNGPALKSLGVKKHVAVVEISFRELFNLISTRPESRYKESPKYPSLVRDLAFVVESKMLYNDIRKEIEGFDELIKEVELFDVYEGDKLGRGKKNLAFHIVYRTEDRTLTGEEVDGLQKRLAKRMKEKFGAIIRNF